VDPPPAEDEAFQKIWREELFHRAWQALREQEEGTDQPVYTVLRFRTKHPDLRSAEAAEQLTQQLGRPISPEWVRKWLQRARREFARCLVDDVARTLAEPTPDLLEEELLELGVRDQCREALADRRQSWGSP
jgi:RNA polymerase sigma-70 factor (ECF subfamily)